MVAAVITGAAGDLGQALTGAFLADGYRVYGGDIVPVTPRAGLVPVPLDVTDRAATFALAERAAAEAGPLRLWINAAGILRVVKVSEADPLDWERIIAVNLTGSFHGCAAALEVMRRGGGGRIVNIGSLSGQVGGTALHPAYGASKAGVHALTRTYALEGARYGVYCNAVAPSVVEGSMASQLSERQREHLVRANPLRRLARMPEVVEAVRYLASEAASYTNGVVLPVNGGAYLC
ncbi:MAG TPA: SDR family NAD(P)-dependent oxidoreductase [Geminicoccaceae bacterium]|jgi:NAD(P)-dependent dehydrogenase (short-subunit alcohol dehydrogenase family)|nr:SDR family NAD(P)-dependent oxidoreductase [Geminicoccaceae bacterium]